MRWPRRWTGRRRGSRWTPAGAAWSWMTSRRPPPPGVVQILTINPRFESIPCVHMYCMDLDDKAASPTSS